MYDIGEGKESEWNEATLKSKRLNEVQERMNFWKINPKGITTGCFNYIYLLKDIENLYGEGRSKYSDKEKEEVDKLKEFINKILKLMPPHIKSNRITISSNNSTFLFCDKNYEMFMNLLYDFEMRVKDLNDNHGLTTRNKTTEGLFG